MAAIGPCILAMTALLGACAAPESFPRPGFGGDFAAFAQDENTCRRAGAAAIQAVPDSPGGTADESPAAVAHRYDAAYGQCMVIHGRIRQMGSPPGDAPPGPYGRSNPHGFEYPDAFFSVPYATPGYGYDGFGYY